MNLASSARYIRLLQTRSYIRLHLVYESPPSTLPLHNMASSSVVSANTQFSIDLYRTLIAANQPSKNVFFSPFSITAALAMVSVGAHGSTKDEIFSGLRLKGQTANKEDQINAEFKQLFQSLDVKTESNRTSSAKIRDDTHLGDFQQDTPRLDLANRVYLQKGTQVKKPFSDTLKSSYKSTFGEVDFAGDSNGAKNTINKWVANVTQDKIKDLFKDLSSDSKLVLVSAIYFKAAWKEEFSKDRTEEKDFFAAGGKTVKARFLRYFSNLEYSFAEFPELKATAIGIPYVGSSFQMKIILPNEKNGLENLQKVLTPAIFDDAQYTTNAEIDVSLPKFKIEADYKLTAALKSLGVKKPFSNSADFSGISDSPPLKIGDVVHKSFISKYATETPKLFLNSVNREVVDAP